jgi:endoglucanase
MNTCRGSERLWPRVVGCAAYVALSFGCSSADSGASDGTPLPAFNGGQSTQDGNQASTNTNGATNGTTPGSVNEGTSGRPLQPGESGATTGNGVATPATEQPATPTEMPATESPSDVPTLVPAVPPALVRGQGPAIPADSAQLLRLAYTFYGAQRSGDGANWLLNAGETCHMNDGQSIGRDLTGGWYDAGDYLKVTLSIAYGAYVISKGYDAFPAAFDDRNSERYTGAANGVPDVLDEAKFAADYLVKAHIAPNQLVAMIGNVNADHNLPLRDGRCNNQAAQNIQRPVSMQSNADVSGLAAAALALLGRLYQPFNATLSATYVQHAREIFEIARANRTGSNPGLYGQTGPVAWVDEALCGATELYRATGEQQYLDDALAFDTLLGPHGWAPNFSQSADFCRHSLIVGLRAAGNLDAAQPVALNLKTDVENYITKVSTAANVQGLLYMDEWGTLRYSSGAGFGASLYYEVTGDTTARDLAISQLNYITGSNTYNRSFVIGFGNNPPSNPHHRNQIATGRALAGALVGGPNPGGYVDTADDFQRNEVALDYNAGLVGLAAFGATEAP